MRINLSDEELWNHVRTVFLDVLSRLKSLEKSCAVADPCSPRPKGGTLAEAVATRPATAVEFQTLNGLDALVAEVKLRVMVREKFELPDFKKDRPYDNPLVLPHEVMMIPLVLADHYATRYGFDIDEDALRALYLPYEQYLFSQPGQLAADAAIPILGARLPAVGSGLNENCSIVGLDDYWRSIFSVSEFSELDAKIARGATQVLLLKQECVNVESFGYYHHMSASVNLTDKVNRFFEALAVEAPGATTWVQMALISREWTANYTEKSFNVELITPRDYAVRLDSVTRFRSYSVYDLTGEQTEMILRNIDVLARRHRSVRVATRRLVSAHARTDDADRIIDLCIGLEALLGSGFGETVHRICTRAAAILSMIGWGPSAINYETIRGVYQYRSRVVHGDPGPYKQSLLKIRDEPPIHASRVATAALSSLLRYIMFDETFDPDKIDETFVFGAFDAAAALANGSVVEEEGNDTKKGE